MNITALFPELLHRSPLLAWGTIIHLSGFILTFILSLIDKRKVSGNNTWIKPMKFFSSISIYLFTLCWILFYIPNAPQWISITIVSTMYIETFFISLQAARGVNSHFNASSAFNGIVFTAMGIAITINTLACIYILILFFTEDLKISPSYLWSIRAGLFIFILASFEGFAMASRNSHTVGAKDGGKGLPFVNWSREGGDLRIAHFIGLHALQILPLAGAFIQSVPAIIIISILYFLLSAFLFIHALKGRPVLKLKIQNPEVI